MTLETIIPLEKASIMKTLTSPQSRLSTYRLKLTTSLVLATNVVASSPLVKVVQVLIAMACQV